MVDPVFEPPGNQVIHDAPGGLRTAVTTAAVIGLGGGLLVVFTALLFGLLALPWIASGFFVYNAAQAAAAARLYQQAPLCAADGSTGIGCIRLVSGTIATVETRPSRRTLATYFSVELPSGIQSSRMTSFLVGPPRWLESGQSVDVTLYAGKITEIAYNGSRADTDDSPVVHEHDLLIGGLICLAFGLALDGGIFVSMRRRSATRR